MNDTSAPGPLDAAQLERIDAWWRAANYLYAHLNRAIMQRDLDTIYVMGPGHGGPGPVAASWLEGSDHADRRTEELTQLARRCRCV